MSIKIVDAYSFKEEIKILFSEYTDMLIKGDNRFRDYLEIQNYDKELEHLEDKYGRPFGRLYIVYDDHQLVGCIGLRKIDDVYCEMKRLYVRPSFRGQHIGSILIECIIDEAMQIGYQYMLLDTLPFLKSAIYLYRRFGFYEICSYNDNPIDESIYMRLDLK